MTRYTVAYQNEGVESALNQRPGCEKCGRPSFGIKFNQFRCFPHMNDRRLNPRLVNALNSEMRDKLDHIDVGFEHVQGGLAEELQNVKRENAWGSKRLDANPYRRLGFIR